jgi:hypothetical protein
MENTNSLLSLSGKLLLNVKLNKPTSTEEQKLRNIFIMELHQSIRNG